MIYVREGEGPDDRDLIRYGVYECPECERTVTIPEYFPGWLSRLRRRPTMPVTLGQMISLWEQAVLEGDRERAADIRKEMVKIMRDMEKEAAEGEDSISSDSP